MNDKEILEKGILEKLINEGFLIREIVIKLNSSKSTINRTLKKYNIKSKFYDNCNEKLNCLECNITFDGNKKAKRKFCSRSCAVTYNNRVKIVSEDTKLKISNTLKSKNKKVEKIRLCKNCNNNVGYKKIICDECKTNYYKYYRPLSNFDFDINIYKDRFDFSLVVKYGWYSPSNKGNNLNGISRDHLFSVRDGFVNKVSIDVIKHPANCKLMIHKDNNIKNTKSDITLDELLKRIEEWNKK